MRRQPATSRRRGYTLIELAVVLSTIGLLIIIVGVTARSVLIDTRDREAEASLQQVLLAEQGFAQRFGTYTAFERDLDGLTQVTVTNDPSDDASVVSVAVGVNGTLGLAVRRNNDECLLVRVASIDGGGAITRPSLKRYACAGVSALGASEDEDTAARTSSRTT